MGRRIISIIIVMIIMFIILITSITIIIIFVIKEDSRRQTIILLSPVLKALPLLGASKVLFGASWDVLWGSLVRF